MRIGIDARYLSHGLVGGVHTYVANLLPRLIELAAAERIFLYADAKSRFEIEALPPHVTVRSLPWRSPVSSVVNDLAMGRRMASDRLDVVHFPAGYGFAPKGARLIVTVHDALNLHPLGERLRGLELGNLRTARFMAMAVYLNILTRLTLRRAALVLTCSEHARQQIAFHGRIEPSRIVVVPHGVAPDLRPLGAPPRDAAVRRRHGLEGPFILADALKNPRRVIQAWRQLDPAIRERYAVVFFSRHANPLPLVREAERSGEARLLVRPSRDDLAILYASAAAFVFPSWIEGFGLPVLEAMACGAPVIASDRGAIPEVAGDAALLVDCDDPRGLARHLGRVLCDAAEAGRLRERGLRRAAQFPWDATAEETLASYRRAFGSVPHEEEVRGCGLS